MTFSGFLSQLLQVAIALVLAPLLVGWVNQCRAWLQNKRAPPLLLPYFTIRKLFVKDAVVADNASSIFRITPYVVFGAMCCAAAIVPSLATDLPFASAADAIALVGLFALARVFIALAARDIGTAFGSLGARREMLIGFLAEPALLMVLFSASLIPKETSATTTGQTLAERDRAPAQRRDAGAPPPGDLPEPRLRRRRLHHDLARGKRPGPGRQPRDPSRADDDPRGADPRVLGPPPGPDGVGGEPQAVCLFVPRAGPLPSLGRGRG